MNVTVPRTWTKMVIVLLSINFSSELPGSQGKKINMADYYLHVWLRDSEGQCLFLKSFTRDSEMFFI